MNKHIFLDNLTASIGALVSGKKKFFSKSIESESFETLIKSVEINLPEITGEGIFTPEAKTPAGIPDPAFRVEKWLGSDYPTIIYHHGNNERPFDYSRKAKNTFYHIFVKEREAFAANLIVVRAPFHNCSLGEYQEKMTELRNFMLMIAVSVRLNEALIASVSPGNEFPVITSGISLGGWVTNLHRSFFNSSGIYAPLMAGTFLGELFIQSKYKKMTGQEALKNPGKIRKLLNFNDSFDAIRTANVFPLLAKYDQFIQYEVQKNSYSDHPVKIIDAGHVTGALSVDALRSHLKDVLRKSMERK